MLQHGEPVRPKNSDSLTETNLRNRLHEIRGGIIVDFVTTTNGTLNE